MYQAKSIAILAAVICLSATISAQATFPVAESVGSGPGGESPPDLSLSVLPLTTIHFDGGHIKAFFGTAFCLDPTCRIIGTNYHVAMMATVSRIEGRRVIRRHLATGPGDDGATINTGPASGPLKYTLRRDLAIFELLRPLRNRHGAPFELAELRPGQDVEVYSYPLENHHFQRRLQKASATYAGEASNGLLAFRYKTPGAKTIRPGASGGIVVDSRTHRVVGVLNGLDSLNSDVVLAVSSESLARFVENVEPFLASQIFPNRSQVSPSATDIYPEFVFVHNNEMSKRSEEPTDVRVLRTKAQSMSDNMRNFIALQNLTWGQGESQPAAASTMEVRMLDGYQRFREYPDGKKDVENIPMPALNHAITPGSEWAMLPKMVGTELNLQILQEPDQIIRGQRVKIFRYRADAEDDVCRFRSLVDYGFWGFSKDTTVSCYGEVWTDESMNILRISEHFKLPGTWQHYQAVVTYGWFKKQNEAPRLVPKTIQAQAEKGNKVYWCRGEFSDYRVFTSSVRMAGFSSYEGADYSGSRVQIPETEH